MSEAKIQWPMTPYTMFIAGGLRSPSLAKAHVDVGDNANAHLVSADIAPFFRLNSITLTHLWKLGLLQKWSFLRTKSRRFGMISPLFPRRWMG